MPRSHDAEGAARKPWLRKSLWQQLMLPIVALWAACAVLAASAAYLLAGQSTYSSFDRMLGDDAQALAAQLRWEDGIARFNASKEIADALVFDSLSMTHYTIHTGTGRWLGGDLPFSIPAKIQQHTKGPQFFDQDREGVGTLRITALWLQPSPGDEAVWVLVAESKEKRRQVKNEIAIAIFLPAAVAGLIVVPLFYFGIRRGLRPAQHLSALVAEHGENDLSPLDENDVPEELRELVAHTNSLLGRLQLSVDEQRRFIAHAAHQLQTPVAGIRLLVGDMQRIQRADPHQPMDAQVLEQLGDVATRAARLVRQLLAYARIAEDAVVEDEYFDAISIITDAAQRWSKPAQAAGKSLLIAPPTAGPAETFVVRGSPTLLGEAVSNLLDNAIRYGGKHIQLRTRTDCAPNTQSMLVLTVSDDGPALDDDTCNQMLRPFWRGQNAVPDGSGLGLSIAQRIVERMGGTLRLLPQSASTGTHLEMALPRVPKPQ